MDKLKKSSKGGVRTLRRDKRSRYNSKQDEERMVQLHDIGTNEVLNMEDKHKKNIKKNIAATNIQSVFRGNKSRKMYPPRHRSMDHDLITRITNTVIMGEDKYKLETQLEKILDDKEKAEELLKTFNNVKYNIGKQYIYYPDKVIYYPKYDEDCIWTLQDVHVSNLK